MHEDTAPHTIIDLDVDMRFDELLRKSRLSTAIAVAFLTAAIVLGAICIGKAWPPRALANDSAGQHS